ncbi:MAG TPA: hypothetical protein VF945_03330, partial [Polyangia bacterium]
MRGQGAAGRSGGAGPTRSRLAIALASSAGVALASCAHPAPAANAPAPTIVEAPRRPATIAPPTGPVHELVIRGGTIYDGSGAAPLVGDVCIDG